MAALPTVRRHADQRALFELARYGECIQAVRLHVIERPVTAEHRYHCGVAVTMLDGDGTSGDVLARAEGDDVFRLIDGVLARASSLVGRESERAVDAHKVREQWLCAGRSHPPHRKTG